MQVEKVRNDLPEVEMGWAIRDACKAVSNEKGYQETIRVFGLEDDGDDCNMIPIKMPRAAWRKLLQGILKSDLQFPDRETGEVRRFIERFGS